MKRTLLTSAISALVICLAGTAWNLMTYYMYGKMLLATNVNKGGVACRHGFGLLLSDTGLRIDVLSFLLPFIALYLFTLIIQWRKYVIIRKAIEGK